MRSLPSVFDEVECESERAKKAKLKFGQGAGPIGKAREQPLVSPAASEGQLATSV